MNANDIDAEMEAFGARYDLLGQSATGTTAQKQIGKMLSDWQDFYWENLDAWPVNQLAVWSDNLNNIDSLLDSLETSAGVLDAPIVAPPPKEPAQVMEAVRITATWPLWMKVGAITILSFGLYKVVRKLNIL